MKMSKKNFMWEALNSLFCHWFGFCEENAGLFGNQTGLKWLRKGFYFVSFRLVLQPILYLGVVVDWDHFYQTKNLIANLIFKINLFNKLNDSLQFLKHEIHKFLHCNFQNPFIQIHLQFKILNKTFPFPNAIWFYYAFYSFHDLSASFQFP